MNERYTEKEALLLKPVVDIVIAAKARRAEEQALFRRGQETAIAVAEQEREGRKVGDQVYAYRMDLRTLDGLGPLPEGWRGYESPTEPGEPRPRVQPGTGAQNSRLHELAFDMTLPASVRRRNVMNHLRQTGQPQFRSGQVRNTV